MPPSTFDSKMKFDDDVLLCPVCKEFYLHHNDTTVYSRSEDEKECLKTTVGHKRTETCIVNNTGNPSSRRDGICIHFWCETCDSKPVLEISQHKGLTFVKWDI